MLKKYIINLIQDIKLYRYIVVGGIAASFDLSLFLLLKQHVAYHYLIIATLSFLFATLINYFLCQQFVFPDQHKHPVKTRIALTYLVGSIGLCVHHLCLYISLEWFMLPLILAKIGAMGVAFIWNFLSRKHIVFKAIL